MKNHWVVRAGRGAVDLDRFVDKGLASVGLDRVLKEDALLAERDALQSKLSTNHPEWSRSMVATVAGMVFRFAREMAVGDTVVTYDPSRRRYLLGEVRSSAKVVISNGDEWVIEREVAWRRRVARDGLGPAVRNTLGAIQTLFRLGDEAAAALEAAAIPIATPENAIDTVPVALPQVAGPSVAPGLPEVDEDAAAEALAPTWEDMAARSAELVGDLIARLAPYSLQDLVAGVLRAMGYKTRVSPPGPDRGVDIFASPDGLGLSAPRVFVEVKHRPKIAMGAPEIRAFMGTSRSPDDRCLYVSTGGFTREARYEAERSPTPLTLVGMPELRDLVLEHYDRMDTDAQRLVPLARMYWPIQPLG